MKFDISGASRPSSRSYRTEPILAAFCAAALLLGLAPRAHAGHWEVSYNGNTQTSTGTITNTFANNVPGTTQPTNGAPALTFTHSFQGEQVNYAPLHPGYYFRMDAQATITWTPDNAQDMSSPPSSVTYLESGYAETDQLNVGSNTESMQASDGLFAASLLDPARFNNYYQSPTFRAEHVQSDGSYVTVNAAIPAGQNYLRLPSRTFVVSADGPPPGPTSNPSGNLIYTVSVDTTPDIIMRVTPVTASLGGSVSSTVTIRSINGFAGPVTLGLVGQMPTGLLPGLPNGQLLTGGYTSVGYQSGGPTPSGSSPTGPTRAQLAAHVQGSFSPTSVTLTSGSAATVTLTLTSDSAGAAGTYPIEVEGDGVYSTAGGSVTVTRDGLSTLTLH